MGLGGVGQSLTTCLIATLFCGSHVFMDMNVFGRLTGKVNIRRSHIHHLGHENYRCPGFFFLVESGPPYVPQVVITCQEAPSTTKRHREDFARR